MTIFWIACAVVFLLPVVTPRRKWFLWSSLIVGAPIAIGWAQYIYVTSRPEYTGSVSSTAGVALMIALTMSWVLGLAIRYIAWLFQLKREERLEKRQQRSC